MIKYKHLVWLILLAMIARLTVFSYKRPTAEFAQVNASAMAAVAMTLAALALVLMSRGGRHVVRRLSQPALGLLVLYYGICLLSSLWSLHPAFTAYRSLEVVGQILLSWSAVAYFSSVESTEIAFCRFTLAAALMDLVAKLRWSGFSLDLSSLHANFYPIIAAAACAYCVGEMLSATDSRRMMLRRWAVVFGVLVLLGTSSGAFVALFAGLTAAAFLQKLAKKTVFASMIGALALLYATGTLTEFVNSIVFYGKDSARIQGLSGRRELFHAYWDAFLDRPWFGYGLGTVARFGERFGTVSTRGAHNGYFEVVLGTGILGLSLFLGWSIAVARRVRAALKRGVVGAVGSVSALTTFLVGNLSGNVIGGPWIGPLSLFAFLLGFLLLTVVPLGIGLHRDQTLRRAGAPTLAGSPSFEGPLGLSHSRK